MRSRVIALIIVLAATGCNEAPITEPGAAAVEAIDRKNGQRTVEVNAVNAQHKPQEIDIFYPNGRKAVRFAYKWEGDEVVSVRVKTWSETGKPLRDFEGDPRAKASQVQGRMIDDCGTGVYLAMGGSLSVLSWNAMAFSAKMVGAGALVGSGLATFTAIGIFYYACPEVNSWVKGVVNYVNQILSTALGFANYCHQLTNGEFCSRTAPPVGRGRHPLE